MLIRKITRPNQDFHFEIHQAWLWHRLTTLRGTSSWFWPFPRWYRLYAIKDNVEVAHYVEVPPKVIRSDKIVQLFSCKSWLGVLSIIDERGIG